MSLTWRSVGLFDVPVPAYYVALSADGGAVMVIGLTEVMEYKVWTSGADLFDSTTYTSITTDAFDIPSSTKIFVSSDLDVVVIPMSTSLLILRDGGATASTYVLPEGYSCNGWVAGSSTGEHLLVQGGSGLESGFFCSDDYGDTWSFIETWNSDDGGYWFKAFCIDDTGQIVYALGEEPEHNPALQAESSTGPGGLTGGASATVWSGSGAFMSSDGSEIFVARDDWHNPELPPVPGLYRDPLGDMTLLLESGAELLKFCISGTGGTILAGLGSDPETSTTQYSLDTGATWTNGSAGIAPQWSNIAVSLDGSRLAILNDITGELWLTDAEYTRDLCLDTTPFTTPNTTPQSE